MVFAPEACNLGPVFEGCFDLGNRLLNVVQSLCHGCATAVPRAKSCATGSRKTGAGLWGLGLRVVEKFLLRTIRIGGTENRPWHSRGTAVAQTFFWPKSLARKANSRVALVSLPFPKTYSDKLIERGTNGKVVGRKSRVTPVPRNVSCTVQRLPTGGAFGQARRTGNLTADCGETMLRFEDAVMGVQAMVNRPDLVDGLTKQVDAAYAASRASEFSRCMEDKAPLDVVVCIGQGRCLYPSGGSEKRFCAFCKILPAGPGASARGAEEVRRLVMGN